ncbi:hypothetical protein [Stutzerimonas xanthomarina]|uniref:hypothetical protein n=1 Tax=Stutzerimonas xanthomarina TaxID=271420 RepID=UPI003AA9818B
MNSTLKMTLNKDTAHSANSPATQEKRGKGGKTNPKVLLVAVAKRLNLGCDIAFPDFNQ